MQAIAYIRVSTARQGQSGLGQEAQLDIIQTHCRAHGLQLAQVFVEVQSGKDTHRPQLALAMEAAKALRATLIVAKLDRLARNAAFLDEIARSGVDLVFCNLPELPPGPTGRFVVQMMAIIAEMEAGLIAERTRDALKAAKERGTKLGGYRGKGVSQQAREAAARARRDAADKHALAMVTYLRAARTVCREPSNYDLAEYLNEHGPRELRGEWTLRKVQSLTARLEAIQQRRAVSATQLATW